MQIPIGGILFGLVLIALGIIAEDGTIEETKRHFSDRGEIMAWRCSAATNADLVGNMARARLITKERVREIMLSVDRANYSSERPYEDAPQRIGYNATISAPHMHAFALESLEPYIYPGANVLDVGSGSGYLSVCMARMVQQKPPSSNANGHVTGIDYVPELVQLSEENVRRSDGDLLSTGILELRVGDGWKGAPDKAPFDAIHVGAAAETPPQALVSQLKPNGRLIVPVGPDGGDQHMLQIDRVNGVVSARVMMGVSLISAAIRYVPLVHVSSDRGTSYANED